MELNNLSKHPSNKYLGVVVNFDQQKEQVTGQGWGWRYKVAIMDSYSNTVDISDAQIEYAIAVLPTTAGSGGANRMQSVRIVQGDVVILEKISGIPHIVGMYGRTSQVKFGSGRFDVKSGFALGLKAANILENQEINSCEGVCTPKATNKSSAGGSGSDKSERRATPYGKLAEIGIDAFSAAATGDFVTPIISVASELLP